MNVLSTGAGVPSPSKSNDHGRMGLPRLVGLALRELRSGLRGFIVFILCVALGVMVITAVGSVTDALKDGLDRQGRLILGGDATLQRTHAPVTEAERAWLAARGHLSETAAMRTMARSLDGEEQALVELKGVDGAYPLVGEFKLVGGGDLATAIATAGGQHRAAVDPILLERLRLKVGDRFRIGEAELVVGAAIATEPDSISDRLTFGPRILVPMEAFRATGLLKPGALVRWRYALTFDGGAGDASEGASGDAALQRFSDAVKQEFPEAGFTVRDRRDPSPQIRRTLERLRQFLTLIGLTALLVGGVGVANAVKTFVDRRRKVIATMKSLGATNGLVLRLFLLQVAVMAAVGVAAGIALGLVVPQALHGLYADALPFPTTLTVSSGTVLVAAGYGFLVSALFTLWPLGLAERVAPAVLFRDEVDEGRTWPRPAIVAAIALVGLVLAAGVILSSDSQRIASYFVAGLVVVFGVFLLLGFAVTWVARRLPRPRYPALALALANIGAPGGLTRSVILSLGAGLSLLVAVALADASLVNELTTRLPANSPNYFLLDIPRQDMDAVQNVVRSASQDAKVESAPMLRGRLVRLGERPVESIKAPPEAEWVLRGDRGLTYSDTVPEGSKVVAGTWWGPGYDGEPLVSFEAELAKQLGVGLGDTVTVNVLGRNLTARISNLREVNWESLAINFVMVFSPNTLKGAPHNLLATVALPAGTPLAAEAEVARAVGKAYPTVTVIRVKDAINAFSEVFGKIMTAVRVAGLVTLMAGALVLAGALATVQRRRILEAVILKALGATRRRILAAHVLEYLIIAAATAALAVGFGALAAWVALEGVMDVAFTFSWAAVGLALGISTALVVLLGGAGTWQVLAARPVPYLRSE
ncbi:MAG: ABC transporter permease [Hyphomicrobiaceae bacterium]